MKTKPYLLGLALLVLASLLLRFGGAFGPSAVGGGRSVAADPVAHQMAPIIRGAAHAAGQMPAAPAGLALSREEKNTLVTGLLARLGRCDEAQRNAEIRKFVTGCDVAELEDMLDDESSTAALPEDLAQAMLRRLAREDGPWIGDFLRAMPAGTFRGELLGTAMVEWGRNDLSAALEWAQNLNESALQETALVHLSYRWFEENPEEALAYAALNPTEHRQLLTTLVGQWSRQQPEAAAAWAAEFSANPTMAGVASSAVAAWAQKDDLAAAEFVLGLPDGPLRQEAAISVMSALAQHDPGTGALWMAAFPAGSNRDYAIENLLYNWAVSDPNSALNWANRLAGPERDTAIFAGAGGLVESNPALAASWVMSIRDEARRFQQSERVAERWLRTDRWSAEAWIRSSSLPDQTKTRLLASARSGS
jgi:hypothetical protein